MLYGVIFIFIGITKIARYFVSKGNNEFYNYDWIYGIIAIIIGIITIFYTGTIFTVLRIIIGVWIIYSSLVRVSFGMKLKKVEDRSWKVVIALAILMLIFGIYMVFNTNAVLLTIGAVIIAYAVMDLIESIIFVKDINKIF
ncbi:MAG: hypothetical protein HFJ54_08455 [Clostridia bacterium]|nr:hypothetical protein [Clostridia bacterium]